MFTAAESRQKNKPLGTRAENSSSRGNDDRKNSAIRTRFKLQRKAQRLLPNEKIANCMRRPVPAANYIVGTYNPDLDIAGFKNLVCCDSYSCPVCASKRAEQDRRKLTVAMAQAKAKGYHVIMVTFTLSHLVCSALNATRDGLAKSYDAVFSGDWYKNLKEEYGIVGKIKAWESTYGRNGWHPHIHALFILEYELSKPQISGLENLIYMRYSKALEKRGFHASRQHGVDIRTAQSDIADYVAKFGREPKHKAWGADSEIAYTPTKQAAMDGMTPFQLLAAADGDSGELSQLAVIHKGFTPDQLKQKAADLYVEYFAAMKRTPRIVWSDGLKELLDIENALISVQAAEPDFNETTINLFMVPVGENWQTIIGKWNTADLRGELLVLMRTNDKEKILKFMEENNIKCIFL